jgi:hypothetical protein
MATKKSSTGGPSEVQVFELTMDNDENQDELNRRFRKPGEPGYSKPAKNSNGDLSESANAPKKPAGGSGLT